MQDGWPVRFFRNLQTGRFLTPACRLQLCALAIAAALAGDVAAYVWPGLPRFWAQFLTDFDYLAIVLGGISFGPKGGLITAALAGISHTLIQQFGFNRPGAGQGELTLFILVGLLAGYLAEHKLSAAHSERRLEEGAFLGQNSWTHPSGHPFPAFGQQITPALVHQLRTPLASIQGAGFVLEDGKLPDDQRRELVTILLKECQKLDLLIGLMDANQSWSSEHHAVDISGMLDEVIRRALATANKPTFSIQKEAALDLPQLHCERESIEEAVLNVVLDSMKAMPQGGKIVLASRAVHGEILIQVTDQRAHANADHLHRAVNSMSMCGWPELDLAIAQHIVMRHGGAMRIEQNADLGITFSVILPQVSGAHV